MARTCVPLKPFVRLDLAGQSGPAWRRAGFVSDNFRRECHLVKTSIDKMRSNMRRNSSYRAIAEVCAAGAIASVTLYSSLVQAQTSGPKFELDPFWAKLPS